MRTKKIDPKEKAVKQNHDRKYRGQPSYAIPVWNGVLEHRDKIGPAIWEFLWCLDKITVEDDHDIGWLLGKTPIDTKRIARDLNEHPRTAYDNLDRLADQGYIVRKRTRRGYVIGVVNSKKFHVFRSRSDSQKTVTHAPDDSQKTVNHHPSDSQKTVNHDSQKTVTHDVCDSQFSSSVSDRKHSLEETVQEDKEDKVVQSDKTKFDSTARGDSAVARPPLSREVQKLIVGLEKDLRGQLSGWEWDAKQTEPKLHDIREWFETEARDQGIDFRQIGDLYVETMARVRKQLDPAETIQHEPFTQTDLDNWPVDNECLEVTCEPGCITMLYPYGVQTVRVGETSPDWFPFEDQAVEEPVQADAMPTAPTDTPAMPLVAQ